MDLGLRGKKAIVCASSQGLGFACARSLVREGATVFINGRNRERLAEASRKIEKETGSTVTPVVADLNEAQGRTNLIAACPEPDILVNSNGGPPPGNFSDWSDDDWRRSLEENFMVPVVLLRAVLPGMRSRKFGRIVNITSSQVKSPLATMGLSTAARSGLTAVCKSISREVIRDNVTINNLLPERVDTQRQMLMAKFVAESRKISIEEARALQIESVAAKRMGTLQEFGDACAYFCSEQAGYISGQNLHVDGGSYSGVF
tara:strand:- start:2800 stop:3579 length:780 start_codon:yes stop_codon:yes gene_type:complete